MTYDIVLQIHAYILVLDYKIVADKTIMTRRKNSKFVSIIFLSRFVSTIKLVTG